MDRLRTLVVDWWLPAALLAVLSLEVGSGAVEADARDSAVLAALVPLAIITGRRRHEPVVVAIGAALLVAVFVFGVQADPGAQPPLVAFLALLVANFSLGLRGRSLAGTLLVGGLELAVQVAAVLDGQVVGDVVPSIAFLGGAFVIGRLFLHSRDEADAERDRAARIEAERAHHIAEAATAERSRIARELHDVIAHSLSLIVVQTSVEARVAGPSDRAAETLRSVEQQGRVALLELRRLLGMLREDDAGLAPLPRLADVEALLATLRGSGHEATAHTVGEPRDLPPGVELAAYRVLQEAVTNVVKHAPGADVVIELGYLPHEIRVTVTNGPAQGPRALDLEPGAGIAGMRERVRIYGGILTTERTPDGGFAVKASIPEEIA